MNEPKKQHTNQDDTNQERLELFNIWDLIE